MTQWVVLGLLVLVLLLLIEMYNTLVRMKIQGEDAWADVDMQLKRRYDLIPDLAAIVASCLPGEPKLTDALNSACELARVTTNPHEKALAENGLSDTLKNLYALSETKPQLNASESFCALQNSMSEVEDTAEGAIQHYNAVARDLNEKFRRFPTSVFTKVFGFKLRELFEVPSSAEREEHQASFVIRSAPRSSGGTGFSGGRFGGSAGT